MAEEPSEQRRDYSQSERDEMAGNGQAMPDGSFPIKTEQDLRNAIQAYGRASDQGAAKAHIIKRANALGLASLLPDGWTEQNAAADDGEQRGGGAELERRRERASELNGALEIRRFDAQNIELRETSDGMFRFSGYASVTEHPYEVADFTETISRGAFKRTLGETPDVVLLVNHGEGGGLPLARTKSGTMTLVEDARGLRVDADLNPQDPDVRAIVPKMQRGDVDQMSFAFRATDQDWSNDYTQRTIRSVTLHRGDVSIVTMGANPATTSTLTQARSVVDNLSEARSGKALSAANRKELEAIRDSVSELLDSNDRPSDDESGAAATLPDEPRSDGGSDGAAVDPVEGASEAAERIRTKLDYTTGARAWLDAQKERCA